jgi:hypothetical protein
LGTRQILPTGVCWCGCGERVSRGAFFQPGHDRVAESAVIMSVYGGVPEFLEHHGFGPDGKNAREALEAFRRGGGEYL